MEDQVCSVGEYQRVFERLNGLPPGVEHVIIQLGADTLFSFFPSFIDNFTTLYPFPHAYRHAYCLSKHVIQKIFVKDKKERSLERSKP